MRTVTTNVYQFEELSPDAQENALDKYREWLTDDPYWYTSETEYHKDLLAEQGIIKPEIYFSGFWNQGDGAVFDCKEVDLIKLMDSLGLQDKYRFVYDGVSDGTLDVSSGVHRTYTYYSHEHTARFDLDFEQLNMEFDSEDEYTEIQNMVISMLSRLRNNLEQWRLDTCREIYHDLEQEFTLLQSDDVLKEHFIENEYEFTEYGEMYNG